MKEQNSMSEVKAIWEYSVEPVPAIDEKKIWDLAWKESQRRVKASNKLRKTVSNSLGELTSILLRKDENMVFSPVALYLALILLAQMTGNDSRKQILKAIRAEGINAEEIYNLTKQIVASTVQTKCELSASVWLSDDKQYNTDYLQVLGKKYGFSAYSGAMGTDEMNHAIGEWVNKATGGLLEDQIDIHTTESTLIEMLTAIYYSSRWDFEFESRRTRPGTFVTADGTKVRCDFMHQTLRTDYHAGAKFKAITKTLGQGYGATFILPDKGVTVNEILMEPEFRELAVADVLPTSREYEVKLSLPKFDISSKIRLNEIMQEMGITDVFGPDRADFTPISNQNDICLSKAEQTTRFKVNEEGVEAASFVEFGIAEGGVPLEVEKVAFKLDRPFIFVVNAMGKVPVFAGKVMAPCWFIRAGLTIKTGN